MDALFNILFFIMGIMAVILAYFNHSAAQEKIKTYIKERGGTFVSQERKYFDLVALFSKRTLAYELIYYNKNKELRAVRLRVSSFFAKVEFINDHVIQMDEKVFPTAEYDQEPVTKESVAKSLSDYTYTSDKGILTIHQEFHYPNKEETVFLDGKKAPDDKYKIGFMNFIVVENGKVKDITMI